MVVVEYSLHELCEVISHLWSFVKIATERHETSFSILSVVREASPSLTKGQWCYLAVTRVLEEFLFHDVQK